MAGLIRPRLPVEWPWYMQALMRETREAWSLRFYPTSATIECRHGMMITVPFAPGLDRPFLNTEAEGMFVRKVLRYHAKDYGSTKAPERAVQ